MREAGKRLAALGECMIELQEREPGVMTRTFGGDTLNTAVYAARLLDPAVARVDYVTALGDDPFSDEMLAAWQAEGIGTALVARLPNRVPGLYIISTDRDGERTFSYWRSAAPARDLLRIPSAPRLAERLADCDLLYLSGISLGVLPPDDRPRLFALLERLRAAGVRIVVDTNYRVRLWDGREQAAQWIGALLAHCDVALPSFDDQEALFGERSAADMAARLHALGVEEVVIKRGAGSAYLSIGGETSEVPAVAVERVVDTTAAGDAFNGGYLAARLLGAAPGEAVRRAHALAARVVEHRGAIVPREATVPA